MGEQTIKEYAFLTPQDLGEVEYARLVARYGLDTTNVTGYAMLFVVDGNGRRWTRLTLDVEYARTLVAALEAGMTSGMANAGEIFVLERSGWPDEW
ncbi:hypothetical protein RDV89_00785 [Nocardioides zeae]|uniref:Uncharacterized protein n=1 Tax=Nocardioides imazamoxiresistens TaxID=3231893 RepID=A0ABU3PQW7_9ACTN|nr:hypothetical protein [Nocardioides zeae]MDT9591581.1 hypothetical protein [Nocardioides zeae]